MKTKQLPKGWKEETLDQLGELSTGNTPPKKFPNYYLNGKIDFIKPGDIHNNVITTCSEKISEDGKKVARVMSSGGILVTCIGNLGRIGLVNHELVFNQQINGIYPNEKIISKFLFYRLQIEKEQFESKASATTVTILNKSKFSKTKITYPESLSLQILIVQAIETQFSRLDESINSLKAVKKKLEVYRKAVLKKAFEGKSKKVTVGELFDFIGGGTPSKNEKLYWGGEIPWASVKDIKNHYLDNTQDSITTEGVKNSATNIAKKGEVILITRISPGKVSIANIDTAVNQDLKIIKPKSEFESNYIFYLFKSIENKCIRLSSGTTVLGINLNNLKSILIPDMSKEEQTQIVSLIESKFSIIDKVEQTVNQSLIKAEQLRKSILKKAFEGKLVKPMEITN